MLFCNVDGAKIVSIVFYGKEGLSLLNVGVSISNGEAEFGDDD